MIHRFGAYRAISAGLPHRTYPGETRFVLSLRSLIIIFTQVWNEFLLALTLSTPYTQTIQVKLAEVKGTFLALYNIQMAAALIALLVPLVFFLALGQYFISNRSGGCQ